jgi:hypothetical protein
MYAMTLDTLKLTKDLKSSGFTEEQAEAVTRAVQQAHDVDLSHVATKADFATTATKTDLAGLVTRADLRDELSTIRRELANCATKEEISHLATKVELVEMKNDILKNMLAFAVTQTALIIGAMIAIVKMV